MGEVSEGRHRIGPGKWPAWLLLVPQRVVTGGVNYQDSFERTSERVLGEPWNDPFDAAPGWNALRGMQTHGY